MFARRRKDFRKQVKSYKKCVLYLCLVVFSLIIIYLVFDNEYYLILQSIQISRMAMKSSKPNIHLISDRYKKFSNRSIIDLNYPQSLFQSTISTHHPHLPIHIFTQNVTSLPNVTKLILLANGFFGDEKWGLSAMGKSSQELMTQLSCPFLSDYCDITTDKNLFSQADAVVYHMRDEIDRYYAEEYRRPNQRFVFTLWESPVYTPDLKSFDKFFNWTMTYRFKSDIVASYYFHQAFMHKSNRYYELMMNESARRNLHLSVKKIDHELSDEILANKKLGTAAALISNCNAPSKRWKLIVRLKRYVDLKLYGRCGEPCPENVDCREFIAKNYYFFFSFENSLCQDYITEKFFATLTYPIVPVVFGRANYSYFIPSSGFIDINDFDNITSIAQYLNQTRDNKEKYLSYFSWKKDYVWGLTQLFTPLCDLCLRLHLDSKPNVIDNIDAWWNENACERPRKFGL